MLARTFLALGVARNAARYRIARRGDLLQVQAAWTACVAYVSLDTGVTLSGEMHGVCPG